MSLNKMGTFTSTSLLCGSTKFTKFTLNTHGSTARWCCGRVILKQMGPESPKLVLKKVAKEEKELSHAL